MNNHLLLEVLNGQRYLSKVVASLYLSYSLSSFDELVKGLNVDGCTWLVQSSRMI